MILGQDLGSVTDYRDNCPTCPTPAGITTYLRFFSLLNASDVQAPFGGLGEDASGADATSANWGAGEINAKLSATRFPNSTLVIGLDINDTAISGLASGASDAEIIRLATFISSLAPKPVYLRIGYEFDGAWNSNYTTPSNYIAAFRRVVGVILGQGVTNVDFVWQGSASPTDDVIEGGNREDISQWYPGDEYVDWVGASWFLLADEMAIRACPPNAIPNTTVTQRILAQELVDFAAARTPPKPVMIAEAAPQGYRIEAGAGSTNANISVCWDGDEAQNSMSKTATQIWEEWFRDPTGSPGSGLFNFVESNINTIRAVAYINANWDAQSQWNGPPYSGGFWGDTRIEENSTLMTNWVNELTTNSMWLHGDVNLFSNLSAP